MIRSLRGFISGKTNLLIYLQAQEIKLQLPRTRDHNKGWRAHMCVTKERRIIGGGGYKIAVQHFFHYHYSKIRSSTGSTVQYSNDDGNLQCSTPRYGVQ